MLGSQGIRVGSWVGAKLGVRVGFISVCTDECPSSSSSTGARNGNDGRDLDEGFRCDGTFVCVLEMGVLKNGLWWKQLSGRYL